MSNQLTSVLERLRAFGSERLAEFDEREEEHRGWLRAAVQEVRAQIAALAPAAKRQRLDAGGAAQATAAQPEEQVRGWRLTDSGSLAGGRVQSPLMARSCSCPSPGCRWLSQPGTRPLPTPLPPAHSAAPALQPAEPTRGRKGRGRKAEQQQPEKLAPEPAAEAEPAPATEAAKPAGRGRRDRKQPQKEEPKEEQTGGSDAQLGTLQQPVHALLECMSAPCARHNTAAALALPLCRGR